MLETLKRWLHFTSLYFGRPRWDTGVSPPELVAFLESHPPGRALDVGCGTGTNLITMAGYGWDVIGVDMIPIAVIKSRSKLKNAGHTGKIIWGDVSQPLKLRGKFDLILDMGCYHSLSLPDRVKYRRNIQGWLQPEGAYLIYAHLPKYPASPHGFRDADLCAFSTFLHLDWRQQNPETKPDGSLGRSSVWMKFHRAKND